MATDGTAGVNRRAFLGAIGIAGTAVACAPSVPVPPSSATAPQPAGAAGDQAAWEQDWESLIAAAKQEGRLSFLSLPGAGYRKLLDAFEAAFPGIVAEAQSGTSATYTQRILKEREAGVYSFDVAQITPGTPLRQLKPQGVWAPIRPAMFRPDILDDTRWIGGFDAGFLDRDKQYAFNYEYTVTHNFAINTDLVGKDEIKALTDLLDPKWKGRMIFSDVRVGSTFQSMMVVRLKLGEAVVRRLVVDQQPEFTRDERQIVEALVRGKYPVALGATPRVLQEFLDQGLGKNVWYLDLPEADCIFGACVWLFDKAPHPNAARLFVNWVHTREAQALCSRYLATNSRRTDVPPIDPGTVAAPGKAYVQVNAEAMFPETDKTQKLLQDLVLR